MHTHLVCKDRIWYFEAESHPQLDTDSHDGASIDDLGTFLATHNVAADVGVVLISTRAIWRNSFFIGSTNRILIFHRPIIFNETLTRIHLKTMFLGMAC